MKMEMEMENTLNAKHYRNKRNEGGSFVNYGFSESQKPKVSEKIRQILRINDCKSKTHNDTDLYLAECLRQPQALNRADPGAEPMTQAETGEGKRPMMMRGSARRGGSARRK